MTARLIVRRAEYEGAVRLAMTRYGWTQERAVACADSLYVVAAPGSPVPAEGRRTS